MKRDHIQTAKFLIVDDELLNVRVLEHMLEQWNCVHVNSTTNPRDTVSLFTQIEPDIVLLDWMMPEMSGFEVMEQLQSLIPADEYLPILVLTADSTASVKRQALAGGANDFLTKPFDREELSLRIGNLLQVRYLYRQLQNQNLVLEEKVSERTQELAASHEQLRALAARLTEAREVERTQIDREVHDDLGQSLTALKFDLTWLSTRLSDAVNNPLAIPLLEKIRAMTQHVDGTIQSVRRIATQLRPALLDDLGLEAAIEWQSQEFEKRTNIECHFVSTYDCTDLNSAVATAAFRIYQEVLTNISRHAKATHVDIDLHRTGEQMVLKVKDNGRGIRMAELSNMKSLGLLGMRERAALVGGAVEIEGAVGQGTTVTIRIPLHEEPAV